MLKNINLCSEAVILVALWQLAWLHCPLLLACVHDPPLTPWKYTESKDGSSEHTHTSGEYSVRTQWCEML